MVWRLTLTAFVGLALVAPARSGSGPAPRGGVEARVDSLLSLMTLEEKVGQLVQENAVLEGGEQQWLGDRQLELIRSGRIGSLLNATGAVLNRKIQEVAVTESRLKIPLLFALDVIHGYRTIFPIPLGEASTWEPERIQQDARVSALEASSAGIHWTFAPMVDIARDPRWGRIAEGSGEDPYLGSAMAAARVRGFQGEDLSREDALLACAKHFAAYGAAEGGRDYNTVDLSERTLREIYLPPFHAAVGAGAGTLMCSFNEIAGVPSSGNQQLLTGILREEWKFQGFVVSDWGSIEEMVVHGFSASPSEAALAAIRAGVDMDMESDTYALHLADLVRAGKLPLAVLDEAVRRVLRMKFALGLFENPYRGLDPARERKTLLAPAHRALARESAGRSMVLLKNDGGLLPLGKDRKSIAVLGPLADSRTDYLGCWSARGDSNDVVTVLAALRRASSGKILYARGCSVQGDDRSGFAEALRAARGAEVAILVIGESREMSGEARCRASLSVPGVQEELVQAVLGTGTPVVVVLMNGRPLAIPQLQASAGAILEAWFPGIEGGNAVADLLFGDVNPSGKLPVSVPRCVGQVPIYYNHKNTGRPAGEAGSFTSRYLDVDATPLYPFGYGLSYTRFVYSDLSLSTPAISPEGSLTVSVTVANAGDRAGEEVVQMYVRDVVGSVTRPVEELKGFRKIALQPGEHQRVQFTLAGDALAFYNQQMRRVVEPGEFLVLVGGNSRDVLGASFNVLSP
jgi:beta-glucosidase